MSEPNPHPSPAVPPQRGMACWLLSQVLLSPFPTSPVPFRHSSWPYKQVPTGERGQASCRRQGAGRGGCCSQLRGLRREGCSRDTMWDQPGDGPDRRRKKRLPLMDHLCPHLTQLQLADGGVGTALQQLQPGLQCPPLPLRHHGIVHSLWPGVELSPLLCPQATPPRVGSGSMAGWPSPL